MVGLQCIGELNWNLVNVRNSQSVVWNIKERYLRRKFMRISIKNMEIVNFKGIRKLDIKFNEGVTSIMGGNGTGKTSVFDAFMWLLFGKDSQGRKEFSVKCLNRKGNEIPKIEHSVTGIFDIDGTSLMLKKILREKWVRKRGCTEEVFAGNESIYEINNVNVKQGEYQRKIDEIIDEEVFRLITNPVLFSGSKWQVQRNILMDMAGLGSDYEIALKTGMREPERLLEKGVDERLKELSALRKKILKEAEAIPIRIDEIYRSMGSEEKRSAAEVESEIREIKEKIFCIENEIRYLKTNDGARKEAELRLKRAETELEKKRAEHEERTAVIKSRNANRRYEKQKEISHIKYNIEDCKRGIDDIKRKIAEKNRMSASMKDEYERVEKSEFEDRCPYCGRVWNESDRKEKFEAFEKNRNEKIAEIRKKAEKADNEIISLEKELEIKLKNLEGLKKKFNEADINIIDEEVPYVNLSVYMAEVEKAKSELIKCRVDTSEQEADIKVLNVRLRELEGELSEINSEAGYRKRIEELKNAEREKREAVTKTELQERELKEFTQAKINMLGEAVNSKFGIVKFKLFDYQINGGYTECCEATVKGVPYRDLNYAMKINAGLDVIRTLQRYYDTYVPVFVDNKESINELGEIDSQLICLEVTGDRSLKIV